MIMNRNGSKSVILHERIVLDFNICMVAAVLYLLSVAESMLAKL